MRGKIIFSALALLTGALLMAGCSAPDVIRKGEAAAEVADNALAKAEAYAQSLQSQVDLLQAKLQAFQSDELDSLLSEAQSALAIANRALPELRAGSQAAHDELAKLRELADGGASWWEIGIAAAMAVAGGAGAARKVKNSGKLMLRLFESPENRRRIAEEVLQEHAGEYLPSIPTASGIDVLAAKIEDAIRKAGGTADDVSRAETVREDRA